MKKIYTLLLTSCLAFSAVSEATIVQVKTNMGDFEINLFDKTTPVTVQNFLGYVNNETYDGTVFHRSVPGFVIQGGGFTFQNALPLLPVKNNAAIANEPKLSNVRGTVAMAKVGGNPNSATNQWFVNLADNSGNLDLQNGGFSVFGYIDAQGMEVVDAIAKLSRFNFTGISDLPLRNYTQDDRDDNKALTADNLVTIESITVVESRNTTADSLNPKPNTLIQEVDDGSSGGSTGFLMLLMLGFAGWRRLLR
ncbi:peptidylprolyl isomerase [Chromatiaceae bacterium AAb-1]|nr:peptidylprolyl isomerase [Chromatiaceae bacterium AAb-1]